jgi:hypothetical protein
VIASLGAVYPRQDSRSGYRGDPYNVVSRPARIISCARHFPALAALGFAENPVACNTVPRRVRNLLSFRVQNPITALFLLLGSGMILGWTIFSAKLLGAKVTASWTYDYEPQPACSVTVSVNCIDHFEIEDTTGEEIFIKKVPNPASPVGRVDHISTAFSYGPPFGTRSISVIAVGRNHRGKRVTSNPYAARATVTITPGAKLAVIF